MHGVVGEGGGDQAQRGGVVLGGKKCMQHMYVHARPVGRGEGFNIHTQKINKKLLLSSLRQKGPPANTHNKPMHPPTQIHKHTHAHQKHNQ